MADTFIQGENDNAIEIFLIWGSTGVEYDGTNKWDPEDLPTIKWDSNFGWTQMATN